jgi:ABC-type phosphate transport system substrate-binding protein
MISKLTSLSAAVAMAVAVLAPPPRANAEGGYRIVVNPDNPLTVVDRADLARVFMKMVTSWPNGTPATAIDQPRTAAVRAAFSRDVHKMDVDAVVARWATLVYAGREMPPPVKASDQEVLDFVRHNPGAVGYVSTEAPTEGVKVISLR